jgi:hypothetical protein
MTASANKLLRQLSICTLLILFSLSLPAQTTTNPTAPVPPQIGAAKTIFLANAGEETNNFSERGYADLYNGLTQWNHYQLTSNPASADLILELHYLSPIAGESVFKGESMGTSYTPRFRLVILDRATNVIVWSVSEFVNTTARKKTFEQQCDDAVDLLLNDLKALSAGQLPTVAAASKAKK